MKDTSKRKGFTSQLPQVATERDLQTKWSGRSDNFRCYMCGYEFKVGDYWRWVYADRSNFVKPFSTKMFGVCNLMTCESCDGPDILERWVKKHEEFYSLINWALWRD